MATLKGRKDVAELLISKGVNIEAKNKYERTALHVAASNGK